MFYLMLTSRFQRIFPCFLSIDQCSIRMITWRRCSYGYMRIYWSSIFVLYEYFRSLVRHLSIFSFEHVWFYPSMEATFYCNVERLPRKLQANLEWPRSPPRVDREHCKPRANPRGTWRPTPASGIFCSFWRRAIPYENTCCYQLALCSWCRWRSNQLFFNTIWEHSQFWSVDLGCAKYSSVARPQHYIYACSLGIWQTWSRWVENLAW